MCKPMRAEFSRPREKYRYNKPLRDDNEQTVNEPVKIMTDTRNFRGPFTESYKFEFPTQQVGINLQDYTGSNLAKVDPTQNFFNEKVLCDILTREEDIKDLESATQSHKLENFIWSYK